MNRLELATSRAALRQSQSGAVMFLVTMVLSVLASVGLYALAAATSEVQASGSARQATQTHYLAEYGVVAGAHLMSASKAQTYLATMISTPDTGCWSLPPSVSLLTDPISRACSHIASTEMALADSWDSGNTFPTSYGQPEATPNFIVEYTGLAKATSPPNYALNLNICFVEMTASSYGSTMPQTSTLATPFGGQGIETQRARLIAGPVSGAICQ